MKKIFSFGKTMRRLTGDKRFNWVHGQCPCKCGYKWCYEYFDVKTAKVKWYKKRFGCGHERKANEILEKEYSLK